MRILKLTVANLAVFCAVVSAQTSFWSTSTVPGTPQVTNDPSSVTLGLKFYFGRRGYCFGRPLL